MFPLTATPMLPGWAWLVDYARPLYLLLPSVEREPEVLYRPALDSNRRRAPGYFSPAAAAHNSQGCCPSSRRKTLPCGLAQEGAQGRITIIDVRNKERIRNRGHSVGVHHIPLGYLRDRLDEIPHEGTETFTHCASGYRSQIACSLLRLNGPSGTRSRSTRASSAGRVSCRR